MLLKGINGQFKSGELTAILGPSGAGKSTLLNILAGYKSAGVTGTVNINGQPRDIQSFKKMSCYIMQDNLMQSGLTIFEAMSFAFDFKIGKKKSLSEKQAIIDEILNALRLSGIRDTITDNLSGGEKKRLSIALELADNPQVIILDEPTTGLDELASSLCIDLLQRLAHFGRTVICSVHTPSAIIFKKFDHVYFLAAGQCSYRGSTSNIVPFLQSIGLECPRHYNPADFVIEISTGDYGFDMTERMIAAVDEKLPIVPISHQIQEFELDRSCSRASWLEQFNTLLKRMALQQYRNRRFMYVKIALYIFLGLVIGLLFLNMGNDGSRALFNFGFCFATVIVFLFVPMLPILLNFPMEILLMKREYFNRWYTLSAYYFALTIVNIPSQLLLSSIYLTLVYFITGQPLEWHRLCMFFSTCFITCFISESLSYSIASVLNIVNGIFIGPALCVPLMLLAVQGLGDPSPLPIYRTYFMYISYIRYGLEGLTTAMYGYNRTRLPCPPSELYCHFSSPKEIFRIMGAENAPNFWLDIGALILNLIVFRGIMYYFLKQRVKTNKTFLFRFVGWFAKTYFNA